jgi:membrane peptidoglycan carboxypeptidase
MGSLSIVRRRRARRAQDRQRRSQAGRRWLAGCVMLVSALAGALILLLGLAYADLTRGLPSVDELPLLLNPPDGALLQPTRIYDRTGQHLLASLSSSATSRRYLPLNPQNPQHLPESLVQATLAVNDPTFWNHPGYLLGGWQNPDQHPTLAQRLAYELLLWNEPPTWRRALRERLLAAQITARFGRTQVLEWYLNNADYGHYAYGAEAAAQLYLGKSATQLDLAESALLAAVGQAPALNPLDAPQAADQRRQELLRGMEDLGFISADQARQAEALRLDFQPAPQAGAEPDSAIINLVLDQLASRYASARIKRGGLRILTTLDYDLQSQAECTVEAYLGQLAGSAVPVTTQDGNPCQAARLLVPPPSGLNLPEASASAMLIDPRDGQVLAMVGETTRFERTSILTSHPAGSLLTPFIYLTGFTRGLGPASLLWDVPGMADIRNPGGKYYGPLRLRLALANDELVPAAQVLEQMGVENVDSTARSFGLELASSADLLKDDVPLGLLQVGGAYGVFATQGQMNGQLLAEDTLEPSLVLRAEGADHSVWLDWSQAESRSVVTPALAYLMTDVLSDVSARQLSLSRSDLLEIGRPAGAKLGQTNEQGSWTVGYTPQRLAVVWLDGGGGPDGEQPPPTVVAGLWHALMQYASRDLPPEGWTAPAGVSKVQVCDPSGLLPTQDCPNMVSELFLDGNQPTQLDNLYRTYEINRETGYLATVFTPSELVEERVYMVVPPEARAWAEAAGLPTPPQTYDAIQPPPRDPDVNINTPEMFTDLRGVVNIGGSATGSDFSYYRVQVGQGLNPQTWVQVGQDIHTPVEDGSLVKWDTRELNGLYAVQLLVVHSDQSITTAVTQVSVDNTPPQLSLLYPEEGATLDYSRNRQIAFQVQASDNLGLAKVSFYVDDELVGESDQAPYVLSWESLPGQHRLRVVATDSAGNQTQQEATFTVNQ